MIVTNLLAVKVINEILCYYVLFWCPTAPRTLQKEEEISGNRIIMTWETGRYTAKQDVVALSQIFYYPSLSFIISMKESRKICYMIYKMNYVSFAFYCISIWGC